MKLLFIEDDHQIANFVLKGLKEAGYVVDHCDDGRQGLSCALTYTYDAAIIDVMLPYLDGFAVIDELRKRQVALPVIILSARRSLEDRLRGFRSGSDDYLVKPFALSELLARLAALIRRASNVAEPARLVFADLEMDLLARTVERAGTRIVLQPKEFSLLEYLMRNPNRVVSKSMIMNHVWDYNFDPQTNLVEARICKLREKIDKDFAEPLIHTVRGVGYVLKAER